MSTLEPSAAASWRLPTLTASTCSGANCTNMPKGKPVKGKTITLAPLKFEDALAAALETPPDRKKQSGGRSSKKQAKQSTVMV